MKTLLSALVGASLVLGTVEAIAEGMPGERQVSFAIQSKTLAEGLDEWARQSGFQLIVANWALTKTLPGAKVKGKFSARAALEKLLEGTQLTYVWVNENAVAIKSRDQLPPLKSEVLEEGSHAGALAADGTSSAFQSGSPTSATSGGYRTANSSALTGEAAGNEQFEEILVTGTYIRGAAQLPMPVLTVTREDLARTPYSRIEEVFQSLPQNLADVGPTVGEGASAVATDNQELATGIDLRGLGPQSTLVLLNGQRSAGSVQGRVVDVSAIPLALIDRIEIVTGGRSAIYGSDAVAGVVNLVTRRDFDGAESRASYGSAKSGGANLQFSQIFGRDAGTSGFVAAYAYSRDESLDATEAGIVRLPTVFGIVPTPGSYDLLPSRTRHSGFVSGRYEAAEGIELSADGLYTSGDGESLVSYGVGGFDVFQRSEVSTEQYNLAPAVSISLGDLWHLDLSGVHSKSRSDIAIESTFGPFDGRSEAGMSSLSGVANGTLFSRDGVNIKTAFGVDGRWEEVKTRYVSLDRDRRVQSAFAETLISLSPRSNSGQQIQISLAGRYSDYDDFGHSFDPQFGVSWSANKALTLRAAYSTAFRAPDLYALNQPFGSGAFLINETDPTQAGASVPTLIVQGKNAALQPEEADTWSVGLDYSFPGVPNTRVSLSYFDIEYHGRIDIPANGDDRFTVLENEARYPGLIDRSPSPAEVDEILEEVLAQGAFGNNIPEVPFDPETQDLLAVFPNLVVFNNRINNIASETMRGIDLTLSGNVMAAIGDLSFALNAAYYLEYSRRLTSTSPTIEQLNAPSKPVDLRLRASAGWSRHALGAFVDVNYADSYADTLATPRRKIDSWTTVDATLRFDGSAVARSGLLRGFTAALGIRNLFDEEPPVFLSNTFGIGYDPANADALGRFVSLSLTKQW
jgi:iron complex outermembrane recepter protein